MAAESIINLSGNISVPVHKYNTIIIGAGAAGMNCAVHFYEFSVYKGIEEPEKSIAVVTAGLGMGASRMSGSDKQTYYKLGTSPTVADSAMDFAKTLTAFGCTHGDLALAEGESSLRELYHLVQAGVPFPHDPEGSYIGYKTDHDPYERATSAGPKTSRFMSECLQKQVEKYGIPIFDKQEIVQLITEGEGNNKTITGIVTIDKNRIEDKSHGLTVFQCNNLVLAAGGPGGLFEVSVYPKGQFGIHGLAFEAGLKANNLTELQFGLASTKFRWNVSGTYMQVIPRIFSTDESGRDEREFLAPYFDSTAKMATNVFLKGYQWPFDPQRIADQQSSLIDVLVYYETQILGRRVYMDFLHNPIPGDNKEPFDLKSLDKEALVYLERNQALQDAPIERLKKMNPPAIEIYAENGIDLYNEPLEINVCAQHHNGGFAVDKWWKSNISNTFVIGEMAGTHGVKRPGGSALNAGQVGGLRAAEYIVNVLDASSTPDSLSDSVIDKLKEICESLDNLLDSTSGIRPGDALNEIQRNMSLYGGHIREITSCKAALTKARELYKKLYAGEMQVKSARELVDAVRARHLALSQIAFLTAIVEYLKSDGGSRGSFVVLADDGEPVHQDLINPVSKKPFAIIPENINLRDSILEVEISSLEEGTFNIANVPARPIPTRDDAFELAWSAYRNGDIYKM